MSEGMKTNGLEAADLAYLTMLKLDYTHPLRQSLDYQMSLSRLRDFIAEATGADPEAIQGAYEAKARGETE